MSGPVAIIRAARRAALRRRYGYAALRVLRKGIRRAVAVHRARQLAPARYAVRSEEIVTAYADAMKALRRRWPQLDLLDPRGDPAP